MRVIFGGQLVKGRGLDTLLGCAEILKSEGSNIQFIIAGDGPERKGLEAMSSAKGLSNVSFVGALPREDYRELALSCSLGIAITVVGVTPPSFPSKIVEYCKLGLPVLVSTEASSDAGDIVANAGAGVSVPAGDPVALAVAIADMRQSQCSGELDRMAARAGQLFLSDFSVVRAVEDLERLTALSSDG